MVRQALAERSAAVTLHRKTLIGELKRAEREMERASIQTWSPRSNTRSTRLKLRTRLHWRRSDRLRLG